MNSPMLCPERVVRVFWGQPSSRAFRDAARRRGSRRPSCEKHDNSRRGEAVSHRDVSEPQSHPLRDVERELRERALFLARVRISNQRDTSPLEREYSVTAKTRDRETSSEQKTSLGDSYLTLCKIGSL